jgi:uncharacterized protein
MHNAKGKRMKKRLRKKLRKGEFQELGFSVKFILRDNISKEELDSFLDTYIVEAIESHGLVFGGGGHHKWEGFITLDQRGSTTEDHRQQVASWLSKHQDILEFNVGELRDAWYDTGE